MSCRPDSTGANWFQCSNGTVGCPRIHNGRTPHCIACTEGSPCPYRHNPPVLEQDEQAYYAEVPPGRYTAVRAQ